MKGLLAALIATAFITGGVGGLIWVGNRDGDTSWYPWFSDTVAARLLMVATAAASLAFATWIFTALT